MMWRNAVLTALALAGALLLLYDLRVSVAFEQHSPMGPMVRAVEGSHSLGPVVGETAELPVRPPRPKSGSTTLDCPVRGDAWVVVLVSPRAAEAATDAWGTPAAALERLLDGWEVPAADKGWNLMLVVPPVKSDEPGLARAVGLSAGVAALRIGTTYLSTSPLRTAKLLLADWTASDALPGSIGDAVSNSARAHPAWKSLGYLHATACGARALLDVSVEALPWYDVLWRKEAGAPAAAALVLGPRGLQYHSPYVEMVGTVRWPPFLFPAGEGWGSDDDGGDLALSPRSDVCPITNIFSLFNSPPGLVPRGFPVTWRYAASHVARHRIRPGAGQAPPRPLLQVLVAETRLDTWLGERLTSLRAHAPRLRPVRYKIGAPSPFALGAGAYTPLPGDGVFAHADAIWALGGIPGTAHAAVADIARGYIAQRALWETGSSVAVSLIPSVDEWSPPPSRSKSKVRRGFAVDDERDGLRPRGVGAAAADGARDFGEGPTLLESVLEAETAVGLAVPRLIALLDAWRYRGGVEGDAANATAAAAGASDALFDRLESLYAAVAAAPARVSRALRARSAALTVRAWIDDLVALGYAPPDVATPPASPRAAAADVNLTVALASPATGGALALAPLAPYPAALHHVRGVESSLYQFAADDVETLEGPSAPPASPPPATKWETAICVTGLMDRLTAGAGLLDSLEDLRRAYGNVRVFAVLGTFGVDVDVADGVHRLEPLTGLLLHRDWHLNPHARHDAQAMPQRSRSGYTAFKTWAGNWLEINKNGAYWHQLWELEKCWEMAARWARDASTSSQRVEFRTMLRIRADYETHWNSSFFSSAGDAHSAGPSYATSANWDTTVVVPGGQAWNGVNDRAAVGGASAMFNYMTRLLRVAALRGTHEDRTWAEPFLDMVLQSPAPKSVPRGVHAITVNATYRFGAREVTQTVKYGGSSGIYLGPDET